jgi:hypothetical protein
MRRSGCRLAARGITPMTGHVTVGPGGLIACFGP